MDENNRNPFASASTRAGGSTSASSNSSFSSSVADTDDDQTIARMLAEDESLRREGKLGKRLSHLDSIPVWINFFYLIFIYRLALIVCYSLLLVSLY